MRQLIVLTLALASLGAILACSGDEAAGTAAPEITPPPTVTARATATRQEGSSEQPAEAQGLAPLDMDDPQALLSSLSEGERSCLDDRGIGPRELLQMTGRSPGGSPASAADIVNCLRDDTVLRLFLTSLVGQVEPFSLETSACIREGFVPIEIRGL